MAEHDEDMAILELIGHAEALKRVRRRGWDLIGVDEPESVADHTFAVALIVLLIGTGRPAFDLRRALVIALLHDLPEALAGDATPFDESPAVSVDEHATLFQSLPRYSPAAAAAKRRAEEAALRAMTMRLSDGLRRLIVDAWEEYESNETPEARLVRQADRLEALVQARYYESTQPGLPVESFRLRAEAAIEDPDLCRLLELIDDPPPHEPADR